MGKRDSCDWQVNEYQAKIKKLSRTGLFLNMKRPVPPGHGPSFRSHNRSGDRTLTFRSLRGQQRLNIVTK